MTPLEIEILVHYYCSKTDFRNLNAPAVAESINNFVNLGFLQRSVFSLDNEPEYYGVLEAIEPYIEAICAVPLPTKKWSY